MGWNHQLVYTVYKLQYKMHSKNQKHHRWVIGCYRRGIYGTESQVQQFLHAWQGRLLLALLDLCLGPPSATASGIPAVVLQGGSGDFSTHCFWAKTGKIIEGDWTIWKSHEVLLMICRSRFQVASSDTLEMWSLQLRLLVTWTRERSSNFVLPFVRLVNRDALMRSLQNDFASRISSRKRKFWEVHDAWKQNWKTTTELKWIYTLLENYY